MERLNRKMGTPAVETNVCDTVHSIDTRLSFSSINQLISLSIRANSKDERNEWNSSTRPKNVDE